jgi:hypothetical protein
VRSLRNTQVLEDDLQQEEGIEHGEIHEQKEEEYSEEKIDEE